MKYILLTLLVLLSACGKKSSKVEYNKTTSEALIQQLGEPEKIEALPVDRGRMFFYSNDRKFQLKGNIVTTMFRNPSEDENTLLYWKHKFKDCATKLVMVNGAQRHTLPEWELACDALGQKVIYVEGSAFISRVIEYAP